jgi:hypothetical protein
MPFFDSEDQVSMAAMLQLGLKALISAYHCWGPRRLARVCGGTSRLRAGSAALGASPHGICSFPTVSIHAFMYILGRCEREKTRTAGGTSFSVDFCHLFFSIFVYVPGRKYPFVYVYVCVRVCARMRVEMYVSI